MHQADVVLMKSIGQAIEFGDDVPDEVEVMSDTTSMRTRTSARSVNTRSSNRTRSVCRRDAWYDKLYANPHANSKSRRKDERKRLSGKEGSPYEEEYLLVTLRSAVQAANGALKCASCAPCFFK